MATECDAERIIKQTIQQIQVDLGNGVINYAAILASLRTQHEGCASH